MLLTSSSPGWSDSDTNALRNIFAAAWEIFNIKFYVFGFETSIFQLVLVSAVIGLIFFFVSSVTNSD